jgi:hypothetical protein
MPESPARSESGAREADVGPYARPSSVLAGQAIDAILVDAIRAAVGPYVPAAVRGLSGRVLTTPLFEEAVDGEGAPSTELPWIDAFLGAEPSDAGEEHIDEAALAGPVSTTEQWPLDDAGESMRVLADDLAAREITNEGKGGDDAEAPVASTPPLPMWGDDDMMDIMPVKSPRQHVDSNEHWAARARRESERSGTNEAAALALESLARRVRDGEISIPGYTPDMGDAAALAAALAALLSVRR